MFTPEYNAVASVQPDGNASFPLVGVKIAGLTLDEAAAAIRKKGNQHLNAPDVAVLLKEYVKPFFAAAGEVARPGRIDLRGRVSLVEAVALPGGVKDSARRTQVVLLRRASANTAQVRIHDVRKSISPGGLREDISIQSGEMPVVPRNSLSKVEPNIKPIDVGLYSAAPRFL